MSTTKSSRGWSGERWRAGRVLRTSCGNRYTIEKQIAGRRWTLTLPASVDSEAKARFELRLFLATPERYAAALEAARVARKPAKAKPPSAPPASTWSHLATFTSYLAATKSAEYAKASAADATWWQRTLGNRSLERVNLADVNGR